LAAELAAKTSALRSVTVFARDDFERRPWVRSRLPPVRRFVRERGGECKPGRVSRVFRFNRRFVRQSPHLASVTRPGEGKRRFGGERCPGSVGAYANGNGFYAESENRARLPEMVVFRWNARVLGRFSKMPRSKGKKRGKMA
jgi:hypothetical protein